MEQETPVNMFIRFSQNDFTNENNRCAHFNECLLQVQFKMSIASTWQG
jgi:hypothetical protein